MCLLSSSVEAGAELFKVQYFKVKRASGSASVLEASLISTLLPPSRLTAPAQTSQRSTRTLSRCSM